MQLSIAPNPDQWTGHVPNNEFLLNLVHQFQIETLSILKRNLSAQPLLQIFQTNCIPLVPYYITIDV
jgi:hypothetical protein